MILRDPMVRTILAVVAICLTVVLFLVARRRKGLSYTLSDTQVLGVHEAVNPSRVQILFDGAPVIDVRLVIITVNNSGNESIRVDDFERALRFSWAEPTRILTAEVVEVSPESLLHPTIRAGANEIVLDPLLLNPGDWLRIKTLIKQVGKLSVDARVAGVKRITKTVASDTTAPRTFRLLAAVGFVGIGIMLGGQLLGLWVENGRAERSIVQVVVLVMLLIMVDELKRSVLRLRNYYNKDGS
jgi:hypothetical protein